MMKAGASGATDATHIKERAQSIYTSSTLEETQGKVILWLAG